METVAVNAAVIVWSSLLLFAPSMAWGLFRASSGSVLAGGAALTLSIVSGLTYAAGLAGIGSIVPLRCFAVLLGIVLVAVLVGRVRELSQRHRTHPIIEIRAQWFVVPLGLFLGVWVLVPPLFALRKQGLTFGFATLGNDDLPNYVLLAENMAASGFRNSNHLGNANLGELNHTLSYVGATSLINFVSAATGLPAWQATYASMGVAVCLLAVSLWALGIAVWPAARYSAAAAVIIGCLASLSSYTYGHFFLAGVLGLAAIALSLAGATQLARGRGPEGFLELVGGGALGVYCYAHLGLPVLVLLPLWAVAAAALTGLRTFKNLGRVLIRAAVASLVALAVSAISLSTALSLVKSQAQVTAGWQIPALSAREAMVWPLGIGTHTAAGNIVVSWLIVAAALVTFLVAAWRRGWKGSVRLAAVLSSASVLVVAGAVAIYGADRYQSWKLEAFLLPIAAVVTLPAFSVSHARTSRVGRTVLAGFAGAVMLSPTIVWSSIGDSPTAEKVTPSALAALANSPQLADVSSLNVRLPSWFETMSAGAIVTKSTVVLSVTSYYVAAAQLQTCTLTTRGMLSPGETHFTDLGGGYVLLQRPSKCAVRRK